MRVRLVISCPVSDWMAHADRNAVTAVIPKLAHLRDRLLYYAEKGTVAAAGETVPDIVPRIIELYREYGTDALTHLGELKEND